MINKNFIQDVAEGLASTPKYLQSKYLYDDKGSELFQQIMELPEYYLTNAELEIFKNKSKQLIQAIGASKFNIIELGAGDGFKTREFLKALGDEKISTNYFPVDISGEALDQLMINLKGIYPESNIELHKGDYFIELEKVYSSDILEVVLFLGSNIGNYSSKGAVELLRLIGDKIKKDDLLLLGVDLQKNPNLIARAYNDMDGVTKRFNLNLLTRINRELGSNFNLADFDFYSHYDPVNGEVRSYLVSMTDQQVNLESLAKTYSFRKNELIYTELSKKYTLEEVNEVATKAGFTLAGHILDERAYFAECILKKR